MKNITNVDTSNFALKTNLSNLKTEVDKLDIDKLVSIPNDLSKLSNVVKNEVVKSKLSNVVKNEVVKKAEYNKLVTKVNNIDTRLMILC